MSGLLIRDAEIDFGARRVDVRVEGGRVLRVGADLPPAHGDRVIDARGHALVPGLHDHHLHLYAAAAALQSLDCGPPRVRDAATLERVIRDADAQPGAECDWVRGTCYHESVAGELDRGRLDRWAPRRPLRIQHRSGRLWLLNSRALERLGAAQDHAQDDPLERIDGRATGRLYDADGWLRARIAGRRPSLRALGARMSAAGITGVTDTGHANDPATFAALGRARADGELPQHLQVMGDASLDTLSGEAVHGVRRGPHKFHLHDHALPDFADVCAAVRRSRAAGRRSAFHCVTRGELVFALAVLAESGADGGDRIEHAGLAAPDLLSEMHRLGVRVVTQPHFISERGDDYRADVAASEHADLYRLRSLLEAGIALAAGSDAPYGDVDPWAAMQAAMQRRTRSGATLGATETLTPEQALSLFLAPLEDPGAPPRRVEPGAVADLCLLDRPWRDARESLASVRPRATLVEGRATWDATSEFL